MLDEEPDIVARRFERGRQLAAPGVVLRAVADKQTSRWHIPLPWAYRDSMMRLWYRMAQLFENCRMREPEGRQRKYPWNRSDQPRQEGFAPTASR